MVEKPANEMRKIPLTQGKLALVDDDDYDRVKKLKWCAAQNRGTWYAIHGRDPPVYLHRFILNAKTGDECDHVNGDGLDNRRHNLRFCNPSQNQANSGKHRFHYGRPTSSLYKGVYWHKRDRNWQASIRLGYRGKFLGCFGDENQAAEAYDSAARTYFGSFARLNFPEESMQ